MPDVGVLNLQIHDNSEQAVKGLEALDDVLLRIRHVVDGALGLNKVASSLKKLTDTVNNELRGSTIVKLGQLADELSKLKGIGDLNIRIGGGTSIESIRNAVRETMQDMTGINTGFDDIKGRAFEAKNGIDGMNSSLRDTQELMQNKGWGGGIDQFREMFAEYSRIRSALSLPAGDQTGISTQVENGWAAWKEGAIEVEGTVSDAMDTVTARLGEPIQYLTGMSSQLGNLNDYLGQTNVLMDEMARNTSSMSSGENAIIPYTGGQSELEKTIRGIREETEKTTESLEHMQNAAEEAVDGYDEAIEFARDWNASSPKPDFSAEKSAIDYVDNLVKSASQIELVEMQIDALRDKLIDGVNTGKMTSDQIAKTVVKIRELQEKIRDLKTESGSLGKIFGGLKDGIANLGITKLLSQFSKLARTRMLRAAIKQISAGFKEGVQNVYEYSKAIGGSFAPNMDSAASSLLTMKNSIGAAVAPLLQSLIPIMQTLVNWFITGVNYLNQFVALLRGQATWTRALPATAYAFEKQEKAAKKAGNAIKDLLADWDELNIIQSQTSGAGTGAGTSSAEDYLNMFEEVGTFNNKIKDIVKFIKENFDEILTIAGLIGASVAAWKISNAFAEALPLLGKVAGATATLGTIAITLALTDLTGKKFVEEGGAGWFIADALTGAIGSSIAWSMAKKIAGGQAANVTAGFTLALAGTVNIKNAIGAAMQEQLAKWGMLTVLGSAEAGVGAALIAKGIGLTTAFSFGLGAMAAIGAVAISVGALIQMTKDDIEWGDVTLTDGEVAEFVQQKMFTGLEIEATVDLIEATVEKVSADKKEIQSQVATMLGPINSIRLGVDKEASYAQLKEQIFGNEENGTTGLLSSIQTYAKDNVQELKTSFAIVPIIDESGKDVSKDFIESGITGWGQVDAYVKGLGEQLGLELSKGFTEDGLAKFDEEAVRAITDKMVRISQIITGSQIESAAQADLSLGLADLTLGDLDKESVDKVVALFGSYKGQLEEEYTKIYKDAANQYMILSRFYTETGDEALAEFYKKQYDDLIARLPDSVAASVKNAAGPGLDMIYDFLEDKFGNVFTKLGLHLEDGGTGAFHQYLASNLDNKIVKDDIEKSAKEINSVIAQWLGDENVFLKELIERVLNLNIWGLLIDLGMQDNMLGILRDRYEEDFADALVELYTPAVQEATEEVADAIPDVEVNTKISVDPDVDTDGFLEKMKKDVMDALGDNQLDTAESIDLMAKYTKMGLGANALHDVLKMIGIELDDEGYVVNAPGEAKPVSPIPSASSVTGDGWKPGTGSTGSERDITNEVAAGTAQGNEGQNDLIRELITLATRIANKEWVVNVTPGSGWGEHNARSNAAYERIRG